MSRHSQSAYTKTRRESTELIEIFVSQVYECLICLCLSVECEIIFGCIQEEQLAIETTVTPAAV